MRLSEERIRKISHEIVNSIYYDDLAEYDDEEAVIAAVKRVIYNFLKAEDDIDAFVKHKIASLSKKVPQGSRDWEILYDKYFEEEMTKRKLM